eukprot:gnl/Spiro4/13147_TR6970_c0_g1_i1.p1 gnl/Spiro4/13147_TR6970_c0_g1~~gnl/Spiro4/13147_TR6970_c0_g1_i1.p1  ORF type:complete len:309 (-),score=65.50 gnl/Spiro4/13147_TR6970_c0_g1_i1:95-898(-)
MEKLKNDPVAQEIYLPKSLPEIKELMLDTMVDKLSSSKDKRAPDASSKCFDVWYSSVPPPNLKCKVEKVEKSGSWLMDFDFMFQMFVVSKQSAVVDDESDGKNCNHLCAEYRQYVCGYQIHAGQKHTHHKIQGHDMPECPDGGEGFPIAAAQYEDGAPERDNGRYGYRVATDKVNSKYTNFELDGQQVSYFRALDRPGLQIPPGKSGGVKYAFLGLVVDVCNNGEIVPGSERRWRTAADLEDDRGAFSDPFFSDLASEFFDDPQCKQ